ncbi:hypothetical protein EOD40_17335 [Flavobacterium sufflavum]|uniref:Uncharacterized protein n=1 Tax=Flavobacterium sufflavum TaxID=1921138 RepID=A0A3S2W8S6_9FLAO|nr:hypothetical protein [Flavobacterium sufflavum]RVT71403.1 hypothetical protein EOD40_17335 [Flavobacterium sufflavum]
MPHFSSKDLAYAGYNATPNSDNLIPPLENKIHINKTDEVEVIQFCNQFLKQYRVPKTKASFQKVEYFLQNSLIEEETNKEILLDWIASNWVKIT